MRVRVRRRRSRYSAGHFVLCFVTVFFFGGLYALIDRDRDRGDEREPRGVRRESAAAARPLPAGIDGETDAWARQYNAKKIPGLMPVDVYLNYTDKGFTKTGPRFLNYSVEWQLQDQKFDHELSVRINGPDTSSVRMIEGTCLNSGTRSTEELARDFLGYVATAPYEGSDPAAARAWVLENISNLGAKTTIGGVHFSIQGGERSRWLRVSANPD